jgi:hypothetical protein
VQQCLGVGVGEAAPVAGQERVPEVGAGWPCAEVEAYQVAERNVDAGVLEVDKADVSGLVQ